MTLSYEPSILLTTRGSKNLLWTTAFWEEVWLEILIYVLSAYEMCSSPWDSWSPIGSEYKIDTKNKSWWMSVLIDGRRNMRNQKRRRSNQKSRMTMGVHNIMIDKYRNISMFQREIKQERTRACVFERERERGPLTMLNAAGWSSQMTERWPWAIANRSLMSLIKELYTLTDAFKQNRSRDIGDFETKINGEKLLSRQDG